MPGTRPVKVCALSNVIMGADLRPRDIQREGIRGITPEDILSALSEGRRWKRSAAQEGWRAGSRFGRAGKVAPDSRLYSINGSSSYVEFQSDVLPGLGIVETDPGPETTAYGLLADMISVLRGVMNGKSAALHWRKPWATVWPTCGRWSAR